MGPPPESVIVFSPIGEAKHHAVLRDACRHARRTGSIVELLEVLPGPSAWDRLVHHGHGSLLEAELSASWKRSFRRWRTEFDEVARSEVRFGSVARVIVERAVELGASLIVLSAADDHESRAIVTRVMRLSPAPVWVMRPTRAKTRRIMVAVNPDSDEVELNRALMTMASEVQATLGGTLTLMTAWELYGEQTLRRSSHFSMSAQEFEEMTTRRAGIARRGLQELVDTTPNATDWSIHLEKGPPAPTILHAIQQLRINLLVIGTVGRAGLLGLLMGNTAEDVLDVARCSALTLSPAAAERLHDAQASPLVGLVR